MGCAAAACLGPRAAWLGHHSGAARPTGLGKPPRRNAEDAEIVNRLLGQRAAAGVRQYCIDVALQLGAGVNMHVAMPKHVIR